MTKAEFLVMSEAVFYIYLALSLVNYLWFLPKAYREYTNKRLKRATAHIYWASAVGIMLTLLCCVGMVTQWRIITGLSLLILNGGTYIVLANFWTHHQILNDPGHPLHQPYSNSIMSGRE
jgi:hypothetical protein